MRNRSETVSFRADQDLLKMIDTERSRFGSSRGRWAHDAVVAFLNQANGTNAAENAAQLEDRFNSLEEALNSISSDVSRSLYYILTNVGEMSNEEAKDLIRAKLGR